MTINCFTAFGPLVVVTTGKMKAFVGTRIITGATYMWLMLMASM